MRTHWKPITAFAAFGVLVAVGVAWIMPGTFLSGVVVGAAVVAVPGAVWVIAMQATGTAAVMMGDDAEQWTASELRPLTRRGWRLINHVSLSGGDIDHVLLGPGGAYALETKWSSSWDTSYGGQKTVDAAGQARAKARQLGLWHPFKAHAIVPQPVVVLWGGPSGANNPRERDRVSVVEGVAVVAGRSLREWICDSAERPLSEVQIAAGWSAVDRHLTRRDPHERSQHPLPPSVAEVAARLGLAMAAFALGILVLVAILRRTESVALSSILAIALALLSWALSRGATWRWAAYGWSVGLGLPTIALLVESIVN